MSAPWIEWPGTGGNPAPGQHVELRFRDGVESDAAYPADAIGWQHIGERDDIIAYRVVEGGCE